MLDNESGSPVAGGSAVWIYGGIGVAIIIAGAVIFHFVFQKKASPEVAANAAPAAARPAAPTHFAGFPAFGAPAISVGAQGTQGGDTSGGQVVVQWSNLPSGTQQINVFEATAQGSSTFVGTIKVPSAALHSGSSTLKIPGAPQNGNFFGTPSGGTPPSNNSNNAGQNSSSTTNGNSPPQNQTSTTSTNSNPPPEGGNPTSSTNSNTTNNVITAACSPNSITTADTSQCVLDVNSVAQNNVAWTMAFGSTGSVSVGGLYTPSATGTEAITGTLPDGTWADAVVTVSAAASTGQSQNPPNTPNSPPSQPISCPSGYVLNGSSCIQNGSMPIQSSLTWNGSYYSVENGLYTSQDMVYISGVTNTDLSIATIYCSYSQYSIAPEYLGNGNYEILGLSSHGCTSPNSINYVNLGGFAGNGLDISIAAP